MNQAEKLSGQLLSEPQWHIRKINDSQDQIQAQYLVKKFNICKFGRLAPRLSCASCGMQGRPHMHVHVFGVLVCCMTHLSASSPVAVFPFLFFTHTYISKLFHTKQHEKLVLAKETNARNEALKGKKCIVEINQIELQGSVWEIDVSPLH